MLKWTQFNTSNNYLISIHLGGAGKYQADLTSYDYDAPMDEAGDPTPKYMLIRDVIKDYLPLPNISVPARAPKMTLPSVRMNPKAALLSPVARQKLGKTPVKSRVPMSFEQLDQYSGFVLYEAVLPKLKFDPSILSVSKLHDRAIVLVDDVRFAFNVMNCFHNHCKMAFFSFFRRLLVFCHAKILPMQSHWMPAIRIKRYKFWSRIKVESITTLRMTLKEFSTALRSMMCLWTISPSLASHWRMWTISKNWLPKALRMISTRIPDGCPNLARIFWYLVRAFSMPHLTLMHPKFMIHM